MTYVSALPVRPRLNCRGQPHATARDGSVFNFRQHRRDGFGHHAVRLLGDDCRALATGLVSRPYRSSTRLHDHTTRPMECPRTADWFGRRLESAMAPVSVSSTPL